MRRLRKPKRAATDDDADDDDERLEAPPGTCSVFLTADEPAGSKRTASRVSMQDGLLRNVIPGRQRISIQCFSGYVRSALAGTQDLLANPVMTISPGTPPPPIEILATHGGGRLTAKLDYSLLRGPARLQLLLVPQFSGTTGPDHREANYSAPEPANAFTFRFDGLAPGAYTVYAFGNRNTQYRNAEFLKSLSGGQTVQIDDDAPKEINIDRVIP